jgi:hypothetical protein
MASEEQALNVKRRHGDVLRRQHAAHTIMVARDATGEYFLKVFVPPEHAGSLESKVIDGVPVHFERHDAPRPFVTKS